MMSFKAFLQTQDDQISDEEAIKKYAEYKLEFKRQQLNEFFVTHKEEEWFKQKYHPEDSVKRRAELLEMLQVLKCAVCCVLCAVCCVLWDVCCVLCVV